MSNLSAVDCLASTCLLPGLLVSDVAAERDHPCAVAPIALLLEPFVGNVAAVSGCVEVPYGRKRFMGRSDIADDGTSVEPVCLVAGDANDRDIIDDVFLAVTGT